MDKKLPNIFINNNKKIYNNKEIYYSLYNDDVPLENIEKNDYLRRIKLNKKINDIFSSNSFIYKKKIKIIYIDGHEEEKTIIARNNSSLITMENEKINYSLIYDIVSI